MLSNKIIVIDNGSYKCRVGYNDSEKPVLEFRNLIAKPRKDKRRDQNGPIAENVYQIGDEIDVDAMRLLIKNQFERNVVTHPIYQEHIFDSIFNKLATGDDWKPYPVLITEPLANPNYCRQTMNELLFECYEVPAVCYGIDSIFSWYKNKRVYESNALILSLGYHTTHVIPILRGQLEHDHIRRLNLGGYQMISYLFRLLQMKYPAHLNAITLTRIESIFHNHSFIARDYFEELKMWDNIDYYNENVKKIQLPYVQPSTINATAAEEKLKRRKEITKRLIEANQKRLKEKREENGGGSSTNLSSNVICNRPRSNKSYQPPSDVTLADWLNDIKRKQKELLQKKTSRCKRRQEMVKRHTLASQERMRIISLLASDEKGTDEFGKDDRDWDVYKKINFETESDSETENEKLMEYENILKHHQAHIIEHEQNNAENTAELYQLHVGVESLRAPELLFQPSMVGVSETGLAELINFVFNTFPLDEQQTLADNIFITGGCSQFPGLKRRLLKELQEMRPFKSTFCVKESQNPSLDGWFGARNFANLNDCTKYFATKMEYEENGSEYFKEYSLGNRYYASEKKEKHL
uniref:Actin-related protein 5 n=1 Tax=Glossina brevipalpis TaxID=37001 RepID=A0A1A9WW28_9MUSC